MAHSYYGNENRYDLYSPDGSGNPPVPVQKLRDGTGDWSVQQDNIACEEKSLLLKFSTSVENIGCFYSLMRPFRNE